MSTQVSAGAAGWAAVDIRLRTAVARGWNDIARGNGFPPDFDKLTDEQQKNYERGRLTATAWADSGYDVEVILIHEWIAAEPPLEYEHASRIPGLAPPNAPQKVEAERERERLAHLWEQQRARGEPLSVGAGMSPENYGPRRRRGRKMLIPPRRLPVNIRLAPEPDAIEQAEAKQLAEWSERAARDDATFEQWQFVRRVKAWFKRGRRRKEK